MQPKISSFFKPSSSSLIAPPLVFQEEDDELANWEKKEHIIVNTYQRRAPKSDGVPHDGNKESFSGTTPKKPASENSCLKPQLKTLNKKRSYAQFHLELGQSDFLLHTCSTCGVKYAAGDESDEKAHKTFHKDYTLGIQFKGWRNERVIHMPCVERGRIVLVLDCDPPAQTNKVQEVVKMVEMELGSGWIFHKPCKVYLFISSQRIAGCVFVEQIKEAFKVISGPVEERSNVTSTKKTSVNSATLQFGEIILHREVMKKGSSVNCRKILDDNQNGAIVCEKEAIRAVCGIRGIWVSPSNRRKGIATQLLDAVRRSFCMGSVLEKSQIAFSHPSSAGQALASSYFGTRSFLVYN
ncbi:hypothetical protein LWI28_001197 [Acer negundo]|uniref:Uncharacterized protein n=1 Tax=Acer negundo TaxID=4023 RepID=A0AAD5I4N6_ACENE|nr:hypothetical protein LWI28_001197 [Acer negundo]KAK4833178.1 hypothetical protein QYF36_000075 [Acer negundo]